MEPYRKIIIRSTNWIGDAVMNTPAIRHLRRAFPEARLILAAPPRVAPVFENNPDIDELWREEATNGVTPRRALIRRIRAAEFDLGFAFPNSFGAAWQLWAGGVKRRVGYARDLRSPLLTDRVKCTRKIRRQHQVEYYLNLLHPVTDVATAEDRSRELVLELDPAAVESIQRLLEARGLTGGKPLIGVNPGAYFGTAKRWLPERFAAAADRLARRLEGRIVITGTEPERPVAEAIAALCAEPAEVLAGEMSLQEAIALLDRLALFVTNDSGGMHLAAARGTPTVAIFGSTDWRTTYPYNQAARVVRRDTRCAPCLLRECPIDHRCMTRVTVDEVVTAAEALLDGGAT